MNPSHYHPKGDTEAESFVWHSHANSPRGHRHAIVIAPGPSRSEPAPAYSYYADLRKERDEVRDEVKRLDGQLKTQVPALRTLVAETEQERDRLHAALETLADRYHAQMCYRRPPRWSAHSREDCTNVLAVIEANEALASVGGDEVVTVLCSYGHIGPVSLHCTAEAVEEVWCGEREGFRNFCTSHAIRTKAYMRNVLQGYGRELGKKVATDALVDLASAPYPTEVLTPGVSVVEAKADFDRALRREFLKVIQESVKEPFEL